MIHVTEAARQELHRHLKDNPKQIARLYIAGPG